MVTCPSQRPSIEALPRRSTLHELALRTPGWSEEYLWQMAGFLTSFSLTLQFVLFFPPFEMWLILEAAELVQTVLLRIHP